MTDVALPRLEMLSREQCETIHRASLEILRRTGVRVFHKEALELLRRSDAIVTDENLVRFSAGLVEWALQQAPSRVPLCGRGSDQVIAPLEGRRGMPRFRPPYPSRRGLRGKPTLVNNVETFALVPWIVRHGPDAFARLGTERSTGTKAFAPARNRPTGRQSGSP